MGNNSALLSTQSKTMSSELVFIYLVIFGLKLSLKLGLGKGPNGTYRIWLDKFLNERSYWSNKDETFESGNLLDPYIKKFNVRKSKKPSKIIKKFKF